MLSPASPKLSPWGTTPAWILWTSRWLQMCSWCSWWEGRAESQLCVTNLVLQTEADIITGLDGQSKKMSGLRELCQKRTKISVTWLYLMSELTSQYFQEFQLKIVLEMSHSLIPISSQDEVGQIIQQLQLAAYRANPFKASKKVTERSRLHKDILHAVINIPGWY